MEKHIDIYKLDSFREKPFWAWAGELDKRQLKKQIAVFKEMGFGGFFIHSRCGLKTEYLGKKWLNLTEFCAKKAAKIGLEAYLYDEDRYPSGACAGLATKVEEFGDKYIFLDICDRFEVDKYRSVVSVFNAVFDGEYLYSYSSYRSDSTDKVLVFYIDDGVYSSTYNGERYLDILNRQATNYFIKLTHERYKQKCGKMFGKQLHGIFSDEFHWGALFTKELLSDRINERKVPFTYTLFEKFENEYGYKLQDKLPELFFIEKGKNFRQIAWQYIALLQNMILEAFVKPYYQWCKDNNLIFTGHLVGEDTLSTQSLQCGSVMRYYEYMTYPGVDVLCDCNLRGWVIKQASSVSKQFGKKYTVSECYGATGYLMNFEKYRYLSDFNTVFGVNFGVPHLCWSSTEGRCKRDYPTSIFYQSCWYKDWSYIENYITRTLFYLSKGRHTTNVCVINPVESAWSLLRCGCSTSEDFYASATDFIGLEEAHEQTFEILSKGGVDFDYLDEDHLIRFAKVVGDEGEVLFDIGNMVYGIVVVSDCVVLRGKTYDLLTRFALDGGKVIVIKDVLKLVDFKFLKENLCEKFIVVENRAELLEKIKKYNNGLSKVDDGLYFTERKTENGCCLFVLNPDRNRVAENKQVLFKGKGGVWHIKAETNEKIPLLSEFCDGFTCVKLSFFNGESKLLWFEETESFQTVIYSENDDGEYIALPEKMEYTLSSENNMVLDYASYTIDEVEFDETYVLSIDDDIRDRFGLERRDEMAIQPWYKEKFVDDYGKKLCKLSLSFSFDIKVIPRKLFLCLENSKKWKIHLNGHGIIKKKTGLWVDCCFDKIRLPIKYLINGKNTISISCEFGEEIEVEAVYLCGDFGVSSDGRTIIELPDKLKIGDVCQQGLPFYGGKIYYHTGIRNKTVSVRFLNANGVTQSIAFDDREIQLPFAPYDSGKVSIKNELSLCVSLSRHNTFGQIHNKNERIEWNGPLSFCDMKDGMFSKEFLFKKQGLLLSPEIKCYNRCK